MRSSVSVRRLFLSGVAGPLAFCVATIVSGALRSNYNHVNQFISELGETGGEFAWLMNYFGFMLSALFVLLFVYALRKHFPRTRMNTVGHLFLVIFAVGVFFAGIFSCDVGCPVTGRSLQQELHDVASVALPAFTLGAFAWGAYFFQAPRWRRFGVYSLLSASLSVVLLLAMVQSEATRSGTGVYQRLFLGVLFAWMIALAIRLWRRVDIAHVPV
ncbi:MAG: DUF998 domain-containing protein [Gammaproteobacteria bacterium]|nr:DUF998 domain-containing protein [Gammaproteobacteria bacterium]